MRYGLIGALILCLGVAEYAYVELAPFPPEKRMARLERMPVVNRFVQSNREKAEANYPETRRKARNGSTWDVINYYFTSRAFGTEADQEEAAALLEANSTATAAWYRDMFIAPQRTEPFSEDGMILSVRRMTEDLHHPDLSDLQVHQSASQDSAFAAGILNAAREGEPKANRVLERLQSQYDINLTDMLANWNGGHFEHPSKP